MIYLFIILLFEIIFLIIKGRRNIQQLSFSFLLLTYLLSLLGLMFFMSKNPYYCMKVLVFPFFPSILWKYLYYIDVSMFTVIRIVNTSTSMIVCASIFFFFTIIPTSKRYSTKKIMLSSVLYTMVVNILYDPYIQRALYYWLYPNYLTVRQYNTMIDIFQIITRTINVAIIILSATLSIYFCIKASKIRYILFNNILISSCYVLLCIFYCLYFSFAPSNLLIISKFSDTTHYDNITTLNSTYFYIELPFILLLITLVLTINLCYKSVTAKKINSHNYTISKQISSSETTSRIFCHYMKNELLALKSQLEIIPVRADNNILLHEAIDRCDNLYERINSIHKTTKNLTLRLKQEDIVQFLLNLLLDKKSVLKQVQVITEFPTTPVYALIDSQNFYIAIDNIITNAINAMEKQSPEKRLLTIKLQVVQQWIFISITDTGCGINKEDLDKIFNPFYTTYSYNSHWGMGLTLTYKVVRAHDGKIYVNSVPSQGTTFKIQIPILENQTNQIQWRDFEHVR